MTAAGLRSRPRGSPGTGSEKLLRPYQIITDRVIAMLEAGVVPWRKPWNDLGAPRSLPTGKPYRGVNTFLLAMTAAMRAYESPYWLTFRQARERGGRVRKGETGTPVVFWKIIQRNTEDEDADEEANKGRRFPVLRHYVVFNVEQCDGIEYPTPQATERPFSPIAGCERIVREMPRAPVIRHGGYRASYDPVADIATMPKPERFVSDEDYYATFFHELVHSTGHKSRLGRPTVRDAPFGSKMYAKEELIAEMGATFLCSHVGIDNSTIENAVAYIEAWLRRLRKDPRLIVVAAAAAQKACEYVLGETERRSETSSAIPERRASVWRTNKQRRHECNGQVTVPLNAAAEGRCRLRHESHQLRAAWFLRESDAGRIQMTRVHFWWTPNRQREHHRLLQMRGESAQILTSPFF